VPTVLVVDDDTDNRELLATILRALTYDVRTAADALTAARVIAGHRIDAVMLDVRMPAVSGIDLCRQLRRRPDTATLPIILVSADADADRVAAGRSAGADDYIVKPYTRAEVTDRLAALLAAAPATAPTRALTPGMYATLAARPAAPVTLLAPVTSLRTA
jgi:DNA-binding response OmpR family regulator